MGIADLGDDTFGCRGSEGLGHGLFATSSAAPTPTPAATATAARAFAGGCGRTNGSGGFRARFLVSRLGFEIGFRGNGRFDFVGSLFDGRGCRSLICVKICRLQGRRCWLTSLLLRLLLATVEAVAHPFTHVQACNTDDGTGAIAGRLGSDSCVTKIIGKRCQQCECRGWHSVI